MELICSHVTKQVKRNKQTITILDDINFKMSDRDFIAIQGPSGCGKSTLLNILCGLLRFESGEYTIDGKTITDQRHADRLRRESIGVIVQNYALIPYGTVMDNVLLANNRLRAMELLTKLGLTQLRNTKVAKLSGGEKQRVAIARALMIQPKILLADEPTGALDSDNRNNLLQYLIQLHQEGMGILIVTHDPMVAQCADTIINMKDGRLID